MLSDDAVTLPTTSTMLLAGLVWLLDAAPSGAGMAGASALVPVVAASAFSSLFDSPNEAVEGAANSLPGIIEVTVDELRLITCQWC